MEHSTAPPSPVAPFAFLRTTEHKAKQGLIFSKLVSEARAEVFGCLEPANGSSAPPALRLRPLTVVVRKRPLNASEVQRGEYDVVTVVPHPRQGGLGCGVGPRVVVHEPRLRYDLSQSVHNSEFQFDRAYGEGVDTDTVYADILAPVIGGLERGMQATVFAYGQTGSGKSYSMDGLTNASLRDVFMLAHRPDSSACRGAQHHPAFFLAVSYFEIYCSRCFDLLNGRAELTLREDGEGAVQVVGLTEHCTASEATVRDLLARGARERSMGVTRQNADSSRSHSVLHLALRERVEVGGGGGGEGSSSSSSSCCAGRLLGRLTLVDLAGSEAASDSAPPDKATHREAAEINKSLLALKECIRAMARQRKAASQAAPHPVQRVGGGARKKKGGHDPSQWFKEHAAGGAGGTRGGSGSSSSSSESSARAPFSADFGLLTAVSTGIAQGIEGRAGRGKAAQLTPHTHVPYRGSKLTQVLKDCFTSPGALTIMLATTGPGNGATEHSLNTLRYAGRLKDIGVGRESAGEAFLPRAQRERPPSSVRGNVSGVVVAEDPGMSGGMLLASSSVPWWVRGPSQPLQVPPPPQLSASGAGAAVADVGLSAAAESAVVLDTDAAGVVEGVGEEEVGQLPAPAPPPAPSHRAAALSKQLQTAKATTPKVLVGGGGAAAAAAAIAKTAAPAAALAPASTVSAITAAVSSAASMTREDASLLSLLDDQIGHLIALRNKVSSSGQQDPTRSASARASRGMAVVPLQAAATLRTFAPSVAAPPAPAMVPPLPPHYHLVVPRGFMLPQQRPSKSSPAATPPAAPPPPPPRPSSRSISSASALANAKASALSASILESKELSAPGSVWPLRALSAQGKRAASTSSSTAPSKHQAAPRNPSPYAQSARPTSTRPSTTHKGGGRVVVTRGGQPLAPPPPPSLGGVAAAPGAAAAAAAAPPLQATLSRKTQLPPLPLSSSSSSVVLSTTPRSNSAGSEGIAPPAPPGAGGAGEVLLAQALRSARGSVTPAPHPPTRRQQPQQPSQRPSAKLPFRRSPPHVSGIPPSLLSSFLALVKKGGTGGGGGVTTSSPRGAGGRPVSLRQPMPLPPPPPPLPSKAFPLNPSILSAALLGVAAANPAARSQKAVVSLRL